MRLFVSIETVRLLCRALPGMEVSCGCGYNETGTGTSISNDVLGGDENETMIQDRLLDFYYDTRDFIGRHKKLVMPIFLWVCVVITVGLAFGLRRNTRQVQEEKAAEAQEQTAPEEIPLEENAYADVNTLLTSYYRAVAEGDTDTIESLSSALSDEEKIRIGELSNYIDSYTTVTVYTKEGPVDGSYVAYVYTKLKLMDREWEVPGLQTMYVCTREDGSLYINNDDTQPKSVSDYIQTVSVQDDVVDLNNQTAAEYNKLLAEDAELSDYLDQIASTIDISVGQQLAALNENRNKVDENTVYLEANTDQVNIRKSASAGGTRVGSASKGDRFQLVEELDDGWSEIIYNGQSAYVKSEFFTRIEPQATEESSGEAQDAGTEETDAGAEEADAGTEDGEDAGTAAEGDEATDTADADE